MSDVPHFIEQRRKECSLDDVLTAVILVQHGLENRGSDKWHQVSKYRVKLYDMVCIKWCQITHRLPEEFPFSEDYVIHRLYTDYRKTDAMTDVRLTDFLLVPRNEEKVSRAVDRADRKAMGLQ